MTTDRHQPDPEFLSRLEWRLMSEMRRNEIFAPIPRDSRAWRSVRVAALVLFSTLVGAAGTRAAQGWESSWEREFAIAEAEVTAELMAARFQMAQEF